jgi:hypothetical protein
MGKTITVKTGVGINVLYEDRLADLDHRAGNPFPDVFLDVGQHKTLGIVVGPQHELIVVLVEQEQ